ncbi:hypothetical protein DTO169C6_8298 [Paecilomyces variotii]|nr:hypothetical protein DTO169C6_8298 [Paecilomyces variotii]KAJ9246704.1 hypothetical protein DTO195F2_9272 [Paecilomyces variotii]KAJ9407691.1 hypothetical protein DTO045G8_4431 [Paecilomyces variotii]
MPLYSKELLTCNAVLSAGNPTNYGYHHGPVPNPNPTWIPDSHAAAKQENKKSMPAITAEENARAPTPGSSISSVNGNICWVQVNADSPLMCGKVINSQPALRRHMRTAHPGATSNRSAETSNITADEKTIGLHALIKYVLLGKWRDADFIHEPYAGSMLIEGIATSCEEVARADNEFRNSYGSQFHRRRPAPLSTPSRKRATGNIPPPQDDDDGSDGPASTPSKRGRSTSRSERASRRAADKETPTKPERGRARGRGRGRPRGTGGRSAKSTVVISSSEDEFSEALNM